nr:uncharacterized protein LOC104106888 [Nicotiana tomentosiformis]
MMIVADFVRDRIVCRFEVSESIITDNASNLNTDLIKAMCETFKIKNRNSTAYRPQMNGAVEPSSKNIKKILRKLVEIPSMRIIEEAELSDAECVQIWFEQLALIDDKRKSTVCHSQLYQNRISRAFNKQVRPRQFIPGQLVLKQIFPHQDEAKGKFSPN